MATVLVTDGEQRSALAAVRSLGRAGHRVVVCSHACRPIAGGSRYASAEHRVPDPTGDPAAFATEVGALAARTKSQVLLPATESSMLSLLPRRDLLGDAVIPFRDAEAFRSLSDKRRVAATAQDVGLRVPDQIVLEEAGAPDSADLGWPVVVKPSRSVVTGGHAPTKMKVRYASTAGELRRILERLPDGAFPVLLQRRIRGPGIGIFLLRWGGRTRAAFAHRRLREKPPSGGVSVYRESIGADSSLVRGAERLLAEFDWSGVAMVEFKSDRETGVPYVMEVNARLWGSLQLAVDAGVDFPRLLVAAALGDPPPASLPEYRVGIRCRWFWGDVDHLVARLRGDSPGDGTGRPRRLRALGSFLVPWRPGDRFEVLRLGDPGPFIRETRHWWRQTLGWVGRR